MNFSQLRFVRGVADAGTFTGGAARCYVTQSTLSTGIANLEKELGEPLFVRTTRSVSLTPFGHRLLPAIDEVLRAQAALVEAAGGFLDPRTKSARIGVCPTVDSTRLELLLTPYRKANRNVRVVLEQLGDGDARRALEEGQLDLVLGPSSSRRANLGRAKLYEDPLIYLRVGEAGPEGADREAVRLHDIADDEFLLVHDACGLTRLTRQLFATRRMPLREYEGRAVNYQVLEEWARVGIGSAILPLSKLSSTVIGHPIVLGNGHRATIRYEAIWAPSAIQAPHLQVLTRHLEAAGATLAQPKPDSGARVVGNPVAQEMPNVRNEPHGAKPPAP